MANLGGTCLVTLVEGRDELDEFLAAHQVADTDLWVVLTTCDRPPHLFEHRLLELRSSWH